MTAHRAPSTRPLATLAAIAAVALALLAAPATASADATAPTIQFGSWFETSPYAHYDGAGDENRLWFNPNFSGSATATVVARDPDTGISGLSWPTGPSNWSPVGSVDTSASDAPGLVATYYDNSQNNSYTGSNFTGASVTRVDPNIDFSDSSTAVGGWGNRSPHAAIGPQSFSARWTGKVTAPENGTYYFQATSNDGVKVFVNNTEVLSYWDGAGGFATYTQCAGGISLVAGTKYDIRVEYYENSTNTAGIQLRWRLPSQGTAGTYQTPTGCTTGGGGRMNYTTTLSGGGGATFPVVPASAFTVGGGAYNRTYSWVATAADGTVNATASNGDTPADVSQNQPIEFVADTTPPTFGGSGSLDISAPGWGTTGANTLTFPRADTQITDVGSSAYDYNSMTREIQRRDGVANGTGGCDTSGGTWATIGTPGPTVTSVTSTTSPWVAIPSPGVCSEFRYRVTDAVGNVTNLYASNFRGYDNVDPTVSVTSITEGTNPQYQVVRGPNVVYFNGTQSGTFTVTAAPADGQSGPFRVRFNAPGNNWIAPAANVNTDDPGPFAATYQWDATAQNLGTEAVRVYDYAGNLADVNTHQIIRDVTGPGAGTFTPGAGTTWRNTTSVAVDMTAAMTDGGAGVASYQVQREEVTWTGGACPTFTNSGHVNIGSPVLGDPPPMLTGIVDTTVQDGKCYRYRIEATDHVSNVGYSTNTNSVRIDDVDPTASLATLPATGSGTISLTGNANDSMSGVAKVDVRLENLDTPGPITTIHSDTVGWVANGTAQAWGPWSWDTSALNGNYRLRIDVTDVAGNVVANVATHDILLDNTAPTLVHTGFVEGTNPEFQHIDPVAANHRAWVKTTGIGAATPSITATFLPDDPESGIDFVTTPPAPAGANPWTPTTATQVQDPGPYQQTYGWMNNVTTAFGTRNATATSNSGKVSANAPFSIVSDNNAPVGGAIAPQHVPGPAWHTQPSIVLNLTPFTDAGADIATQRVERDEIPRNVYGACGTATWPQTWSTVIGTPGATLPATLTDSSLVHGMCYRYRVVAVDNVGNVASTSATPGVVAVDLVAPIATFNSSVPTSPYRASETLTGSSDDGVTDGSNSGIANVTLRWRNLDDNTTGTIGTDTGNNAYPTYSLGWNTNAGGTPDGNYRVYVDVTDVAGNTVNAIVTHDVMIDNSPPNITLDSFVEGSLTDCQYWSGLPSTTFWFTGAGVGCGASDFTIRVTADDTPGGLSHVRFPATGTTGNVVPDAGSPADDTAAPWEMHYTYPAAPNNPGNEFVRAQGNSGAFTDLPIVLNEDNTAPTGHTITSPGGTAAPAWWSNAANPSVVFDAGLATDAGAGVRAAGHVLERRSAPGPACTAWTAYGQVGTTGLASPYADPNPAENACYQYRLASFDNVNNRGYATGTNTVRVDRTLPTGTIAPVAPYVKGTTIALSGTAGDNWAGVASMAVRLGTGPATACTPTVAASWSCTWDTTAAPNGPTTLVLVVTDAAGNVLDTQTRATYVDNELPTASVAIAEGTNPDAQFVVPGPTPRIYVNTEAGSNGDFVATTTAADGFSGVANVSYPNLNTGWTRTPGSGIVAAPGPYTLTYAWTGGGTTADPGAQTVQVADAAANFNTAPFEVVADTTDPAGVTLDYADGPTPTPSVDFDEGGDGSGSGIRTWRIERRETAVTGPNTCDTATWSAWTTRATDPSASPWTDGAAVLNTCYQYRIVVVDNVGNETIVGDAQNDTVSIEPAGLVVVESSTSTVVTEGGATDTYTVRLRTRPTANVVVTLGSDAQVDTDALTLTFTTANWNAPQTVTVTAVQDDVDEVPDPHAGTVTHVAASSDGDYDTLTGADVVASVTDDDVSAILVSPDQASVAVLEAGATSDTYTVRLQTKPSADVVVTLGNADGEVAFSPATLTFDGTNWNATQAVTVTAVDDDYDEVPDAHTGVVTHAVTSSDPLYAPLAIADTTAAVTDDDAADVLVTPTTGLAVTEGDATADTYDVELASEPVGTVTITVAGDADVAVAPTTLTFDSSDWDDAKTVSVTAIDDAIVEGNHTGTASHLAAAAAPGDAAYHGIAVDPVSTAITDNDVPGIEVTPTTGLTATEGGAGSTYQVRLETEPTDPVTISFATGTQVQPIADLTFTAGTWNSYQTVTVAAVQDDVDEVPDPHTGTIVHTVASLDATYGGWALADQSVAITDDDAVGITVDELGGVAVDEALVANTDTFTVVLESQPVGSVTVTPSPDAQVTTSGPVTFGAGDWSTPKTITVTAVDDDVDEAPVHIGAITFAVTGDPMYAALTVPQVDADVADDDTAALVVSPGTLALDEDLPASDTFTVRLDSAPTAPTTVTIAPDAQVTATPATLGFDATNWSTARTVTVSAVDDPTVEDDPHPGAVTVDVTAGDATYDALAAETTAASIVDNDVAGVTIDPQGGVAVTEGTGTDQYGVVLDAQPQADVVVTVVPDSQVLGVATTLTFTPLDWNVMQFVTVTAVDDDVDEGVGTHAGGFTHTVASSDPRWSTVTTADPVAVAVTDDDEAGVTVTASSPYALSEDTPAPGTTVTYDVVLDSEPTADVTVDLTIPGDLDASPPSLTFTAGDWDQPQTVTVGAKDDSVTETPVHTRTITHAITTSDSLYGAEAVASVAFDVTDNDIPGIVVSETTLTATEGGATDTFTVVLETQPTSDVEIDLYGLQVGATPDPLTFTAADWNVPQTVTVTAVDDQVDEHPDTHAGLVTFTVSSVDPTYDAWNLTDVPVAITDNDTAAVVVTPGATPVSVDEDGATSATYTVVLATRPTTNVTVTPSVADGQTTVSAPLLFTTADWNVPQTVTVTAVDDPDDEAPTHPGVVLHTASSTDTHYDATLAVDPQAVEVADDDTSAITVTPTTGLLLDEAAPATTATFTVVLDSRPSGNVDVQVATTDGQSTAAPAVLAFTPATWNVAQTVTVTVVDDDLDEATSHAGTVVLDASSSTDALYDAFDPADVTLAIADDDTAAVLVTESGGSTDVDEGGLSDTYTVRLQTQPTSDVTVDITGGLDATTTPVQLVFDGTNWNVDQTVTVNGTPDWFIEGAHTQAITHVVTSGDGAYDGIAATGVTANVADDDAAGADFSVTSVTIAEGGATATYDVALTAEPTDDVTVNLLPDGEVLVSTPALVFTPANWDDVQTVTVTADDDLVVEASPHAGVVQHSMTSLDPNFVGPLSDVAAAITDNDVPGVTVDPTSVALTEGGAGASFTVELDSMPTANVDVTFSEPGELQPIAAVTFTPADWNTAKPVAIAADDDFVAEGPHSTTITIDTASTDTYYEPGDLTIDDVAVAITDNDTAGVLVAPTSGLAGSEGGAPVQYMVSLTSQPLGPVTVDLTGDADGTPTPATLTFDATDWATPKPVDVAFVQDAIAEGAHDTTISHAVSSSADTTYDTTVTVPDQVVAISDDDTAGVTFNPVLPGPLAIAEGGADATYTVQLTSEPTGSVTIDVLAIGGQAGAMPSTLTFTATDWMTPQVVTVAANDDAVAEGPHADTLSHTAGGADATYAALALGDMDLTITDDDVPGVLIDATLPDTAVAEGGAGDTVRVRLATEPTADVDVALSSTQVTLGATTLTFTPLDWNVPQDVSVTAIQDDVFEGPHAGTIDALSGSVGDPFYAGVAATQHAVAVTDDDTAGVIVTQASPDDLDEATPGVSATYQVRLESEPVADVDVTVTPDGQVSSATTTLTFTAADWDTDQPVVVTPVNDAIPEPDPHPGAMAHATVSSDPAYAAAANLAIDDADFSIGDDDTPGVTITPLTTHAVAEGGATSTYTIVLDSQPGSDVTIAPLSTQLEWTVADITFTTSDWNVPQTVTLRAIDDSVDEPEPHPGSLVHAITTADTGYQGVTPATTDASIGDNDTSDLVATPVGTPSVDEAGTLPAAQYVLTLTSQPTSDVTVNLGTPAPAQVAFTPATVTLTSTNWNTGVTVDVTAVDDDVAETTPLAATISHVMASGDGNFGGETGPDQSVDVLDDDAAGVLITQSGASTDVDEDGTPTDAYDLELTSEPTADVTITLATPGSQVSVTPATLTFTPANWDDAQSVAVAAVDDPIVEGPHTGTVTHVASSSDPNYDPTTPAIGDVTVNVADDDVAGVTVTPAGGTFEIAEGGASDQLVVALDTQPTSPVTIDLATSDAPAEATFTPAQVVLDATNWSTGVSVDVTAVDDGSIEGTHPATLTFAIDATASDDAYDAVAIAPAVAQVTDNDSAGVVVDLGDGLSLDEAAPGTTDTFTVQLSASPAPGQTVDVALGELAPGGQFATIAPTTLSFDDTTWNVAQTVTVTVADDDVDEAPSHTGTIEATVTSGDTDFAGVTVADIDVAIADDDTSALVITPATIAVAEAGATTQQVDVALATRPLGPVEVVVTGDAQAEVAGGPVTLTFTDTNWATTQSVTVRAIDDLDDEDPTHPATITFDASSPGPVDPVYDALATETRTADVTDDDTSDLEVTVTGTEVDEADGSVTVDVALELATRPSGDVTVDLDPDAQLELVGSGALTFTSTTWNAPQTVQVRAFDDAIDEAATHPGALSFVMGGADPRYAALTPADETVDVLDDDAAGVLVTQALVPTPLDEAGALPAATYDVELSSEPTDDVTVTLATPGNQVLPDATTLTFTPTDWNVAQPVTVTAVDDSVTEGDPHPGTITHASDSPSDANYAAAAALTIVDAEFEVTDDDQPGFTFDPVAPALTVLEAGATSQTYTLAINTEPAGPVTVNVATTSTDVTVSPATHTFTSANLTTPVTITVTADDDATVDPGEQATITHAIDPSSHVGYRPTPAITIPDVLVDVTDDDVAGVAIDPIDAIEVAEPATTDTFRVTLTAQPSSDVQVALTPSDPAQLEPLASLTFTTTDWNVPQTVTVQAKDDALVEGDPHLVPVATTTTSLDGAFDALAVPAFDVSIDDDDVPAIVVTEPSDLTMSEADAAGTQRTIKVRLATVPTGTVTITATNDGQVGFMAPPTLSFTAANWNVDQDLAVSALDDLVAEADPHPGVVSFAVAAPADPGYAALTVDPVEFSVADDDLALADVQCQAGSDWSLNAGRLDMAEDPTDGAHDVQCQLQMGTYASAPVTIDIAATPAAQLTVDQPSITIPAGQQGPVSVTFTATDDEVAEGTHAGRIEFTVSSADPIYGAKTIAPVDVDIRDDDPVGVTVTPAGPVAVTEGGAGATVDVVLTSQPTDQVVLTASGGTQLVAAPTTLTFLPTTWNVPQQLKVDAVDDPVDEPDGHAGQVPFTIATSETSGYGTLTVPPLDATITDNDTPGVLVTLTDGGTKVTEGGAGDTMTVRLGTRPSADVTVAMNPDAQLTAAPASLRFTPSNWNVAQQVEVDGAQDTVIEGEHTGTLTFALDSTDAVYGAGTAATPASQPVTVVDDEVAGVVIAESDGKTTVGEAGGTDTYTVKLSGQPTADVALSIDGGTQLTGAPTALTFTSANWNDPQTVTVSAVQDTVDEPDPHGGEIKHAVSTSAAGWAGANITGVTASIADDDEANVVMDQTTGTTRVVEGGAKDAITFRLTSQPASDVSIVAKGDAQVSISDKPIVLTPTKWKDPISVDITALDDEEVEGEHEGTITFVVSSQDASYRKATVPALTSAIGDNDADKTLPTDIGDDGEEEDEGGRNPRAGVPPARVTPPQDDATDTGTRRTEGGSTRTDLGSDRTRAGEVGAEVGSSAKPEGVTTDRRLGGEVVAAKEEDEAPAKRPSAIAKVSDWLKANWLLAALIVGGGTVVAGTGAWLMRGDPIKAAQRAAGAKGATEVARRAASKAASKNSHNVRPRRVGKKKKKDDDEDEDPKRTRKAPPRRR